MPSAKSKKASKSASKLSSTTLNSPRKDEEQEEQDLQKAILEASKKFPSFISENALVGTVSASPTTPSFDGADSKGPCKIWLSQPTMVAAGILAGSLVSVSLASSANSGPSFPLSSLAFECAKSFEFVYTEDFADEPGSYFTIAIVSPSLEVQKNAVRLSSNLACTLGLPQTGRIVFVSPLQSHSSGGCKRLCLAPIATKGLFSKGSRPPRSCIETDMQSDNELMSSPKTPSLSRSKLSSSNSFRSSTTAITDRDMYGSNKGLDIKPVLDDAVSKKLMQTHVASCLYPRSLLIGNFVAVQILSSFIVFQVRNVTDGSANSSSENLADKGKPLTVSPLTTVLIIPDYESTILDRRLNVDNGIENGYTEVNSGVKFSSLGGLSEEFAVLKDIIITSTMKGTFASMGIRPTKGVLLHGPPGTGKTSLARLCAHEAGVNLFSVNGPEIVSQYQGESEQGLHEIFDSASQAAPAVVFIDELDAVAPARKDGGEELSQRMVATLLNLMDGISRTDGLLVIAATNRLESIEPALRRPGRLDREIEIGVPTPKQRFEILNAHISKMEHNLSVVDIQNIAIMTHGFVGADLAALCNEAALVCLRRYIDSEDSFENVSNSYPVIANCPSLENGSSSILEVNTSLNANSGVEDDVSSREEYKNLKIDFDDFEKARLRVRPSAMREVILEVPKVRWEDVGGQNEVKMQLMEAVEWPQKHQDAFKRIGTRPPSGILLFGPPGCSKTLLARAVASESGGFRPDGYVISAVVRSFCELKDFDKAKAMVSWVEKSGLDGGVVMYNVLIHGLCKGGRAFEAVEIKNSMVSRGTKADVVTYCALILGLGRMQEFIVARDMVDEMLGLGLVPSKEAVSSVVDGLRRKGDVQGAYLLVGKVTPNLFVYNALISSLFKDGKINEAELLYARMEEIGLRPNEVTFSIIIGMFCKCGKLDAALTLLSKTKVSVYSYNSLIDAHCKVGKMNTAESLIDEMIDKGLIPTVVTYTSLIDGYCKDGKVRKALRLYHEMTGKGISPNTYTFTAIISGLCRANLVSEASNMFNEMVEMNVVPNEITYNVMIEGYCRSGDVTRGFELYYEMIKKGLFPDTYTFRPLIAGLCSSGRVTEAKMFMDDLLGNDHKLNEMCFSALLDGYCKDGSVVDAVNIYNEMVEKEVVVDLVCYGILIYGYLKRNNTDGVLHLMKEMLDRELVPDTVIYTNLIDAHCRFGDLRKAFGCWDAMISEECVPNVVTYTVLINGLCKAGFVDKAELLCKEMVASGLIPNEITYGCLLDELAREGCMEKAMMLHDTMVKGCLANTITYNIMIRGFCKVDRIEKAVETLEEMRSNGISPDCISYSTIIYEYCRMADLCGATRLWDSMVKMGLKPDAVAYKFMIHGWCNAGELDKASELRNEMVRSGLKPTPPARAYLV